MDHAYINAATACGDRRHECLGLSLVPLTVGHLFLLLNLESPFVTGEKETIEDLLIAVFVCSAPHKKSRRHIRAWWAKHFFWLWGRMVRHRNMLEELVRFRGYMAEQMAVPTYKRPDNAGTTSAPVPYQMLATLMADFHVSERKAMDYRVGHVSCLCAARAEMEGAVEGQSKEFLEFWEYAHEQDRKAAGEKGDA